MKSFFKTRCVILLCILLSNCSKNDLQSKLNFQCNEKNKLEALKKLTDVKNTFSIEIPKNWKREFYVSSEVSRLYFADTTRALSDAFIFDIGYLQKIQSSDSSFLTEIKKELDTEQRIFLQSGSFLRDDEKSYFFLTSSDEFGLTAQNLWIYIPRKTFFYHVKIDVYGNENMETRFCEALQFFNRISFHK